MKNKIVINITKDDLQNYNKHEEKIADYPYYASTSNSGRSDIALLSKLLDYDFGNETTMKVTIELLEKVKIDYSK